MKTIMKIMAALAAIAAAAVVLYHFRDKLKALCPCCRTRDYESDFEPCCCCVSDEAPVEQTVVEEAPVEQAEEEAVQEPEATSEDFAD